MKVNLLLWELIISSKIGDHAHSFWRAIENTGPKYVK